MPRSYQAYPQNAVVTHSPANAGTGTGNSSPNTALEQGGQVFQIPSLLDVCAGVTNGTANPFMSGLNTMGTGTGDSTNTPGQTGNILSGLQIFVDALCGSATGAGTGGGITMSQAVAAARQLRAQGGDLHEAVKEIRRLREKLGPGTTPQTVIAGVDGVTTLINGNSVAQGAITTGRSAAGVSGNQIVDAINGGQVYTGQGHQLLTGVNNTNASGGDLLTAGGKAINHNTANLISNTSLTSAQSVNIKNQNLLVSEDFSSAYTVVGDTHWAWDGTDGAPSSNVLGCAKVTCDGSQKPLLSSEIPVVVDETIEVSAFVKWSGLTYTGASPIILSVEKFRRMKDPAGSGQYMYSDIGWSHVYTVPSPGSSSSSATNNWVGIAGTYVVQPGVDQLRFRLEVTGNATAGSVKWDACEFLKLDLIKAECVPGITDNIVTKLYGTQGSGFTANDAAAALFNTASSITSVSSQIAALQAEGTTGNIGGDDFSWVGAITTNVNWSGGYVTNNSVNSYGNTNVPAFTTTSDSNGNYAADGNNAVWSSSGGFDQWAFFKWVGTGSSSATDYQIVQAVLSSAPTAQTGVVFYTPVQEHSYLRLYGRIASGWTSYVYASVGSDGTWAIRYYTGTGNGTTIASGTCSVPGAGSIVSLYLGDKINTIPRHYQIRFGTTVIADVTEGGTGSPLGSSNRGWGFGAQNHGDSSLTSGRPPSINQWLGLDQ